MDDDFMPDRASEWLLALSEEPDDAGLRTRFEQWLSQSAAHSQDWDEIVRTHRVMGHVEPALLRKWQDSPALRRQAGDAGRARFAAAASRRVMASRANPGRPRRRSVWRAATVAAVAACLAFVFVPRLALRMEADHLTETAAPKTIQLDDGSTVHLGAETAIAVSFEPGAREVRLLKGEAFFEVAPDSARPFSVTAGAVRTTVLGTAFDVRLRDDGADVGVEHGHVRVDRLGDAPIEERLTAGDWVRIDWTGAATRGRAAAGDVAAWRRGEIVAKDRPVADVIDAIRPYYDGFIIVTGESFARQPLTGVYRLSDPVEAVRAVARAEGATVRQISPWVLVVSGD